MEANSWADMLWKRFRKSCRVEQSRKVDRHWVGICTVARSSADSSDEVPMKSNERQAQANFSNQLMRLCCRTQSGMHPKVQFLLVDSELPRYLTTHP